MKKGLGPLFLLLLLLAARPAVGASMLEIDAPGGAYREPDGSISAKGLAGKPLVALWDGYEISAMALRYDPVKQTGQAQGNVRWRERRTGGAREFQAEAITFVLAAKTIRATGGVTAKDDQVNLQADLALIDLAKGRYEISGRQARAIYAQHSFQADRLVYEAGELHRLTAEGNVLWRNATAGETRSVQAAKVSYDLVSRSAEATGGVKLTVGEFAASSERLKYEEAADLLTLDGQPTLTRGVLKLTSAYLAWQPTKGLIVATGGAAVSEQTFTGTADELRYEIKDNRIRLLGAARLTSGQDTLAGEEITYDLESGRIAVTGGAKAVISLGG